MDRRDHDHAAGEVAEGGPELALVDVSVDAHRSGRPRGRFGRIEPAVDLQHLAGQEGAGVRGQVEDRGGDVLGRSRAGGAGSWRSWSARMSSLSTLPERVGLDGPGRDDVDPDFGGQVDGRQPGQMVRAALAVP